MKFNNLIVDTDMNSDYYLNYADLMISDWSGVALEFAVAYKKPIIYIDTNKKINNQINQEIDMEPIEVKIRDKIGFIMSKDEINNLPNIINEIKNN